MENRWKEFAIRAGATKNIELVWDWIFQAYNEKTRFYHTLDHIQQCLTELDLIISDLNLTAEESVIIELAIWFHDIVYDTNKHDNEDQSALIAKNACGVLNLSKKITEGVVHFIRCTKHNNFSWSDSLHQVVKLFLDIDLSILGQSNDIFQCYENNIRKEYEWVPWDLYKMKRVEILQSFIERPFLFRNMKLYSKYEIPARTNLIASINQLKGTNCVSTY